MFTVNPGADKQSIRASISNMFSRRFQKCQQIPSITAFFAKKGFFGGWGRIWGGTFVSFGQHQSLARFCLAHPLTEL